MTRSVEEVVRGHAFFSGMRPEHVMAIARCGDLKTYEENAMLGREGAPSEGFFAILDGVVAIESYVPGVGSAALQTVHGGDVVGWSWLTPPYRWVFDARASTTVHTVAFDARCLRECCEKTTDLGFEVLKRFSRVMTSRLKAARLQLLDMYGKRTA